MDDDYIDKALGVSGSFKVKAQHGPLGWLAMLHEIRERLLFNTILYQTTTEGVQPKLFNVISPIPVYYEEIV